MQRGASRLHATAAVTRDSWLGHSPNTHSHEQKEALCHAVESGDEEAVRKLAARLGNVNFHRDGEGTTPLVLAGITGDVGVLQALLEADADVGMGDTQGRTALYAAAMGGNLTACELLLDSGAAVNHATAQGLTPFMAACWRAHQEVAALLARRGAITDATDAEGRTARDLAREWGHDEIVAMLDTL